MNKEMIVGIVLVALITFAVGYVGGYLVFFMSGLLWVLEC